MKNTYETPLNSRYASKEMQYLFSPDFKFKTWRRLWIALAESEMELGLNITQEQIDELKAHAEDINYDVATEKSSSVTTLCPMFMLTAFSALRQRELSTSVQPPAM